MKKLCLYAGFSSSNVIEGYVVHSVKELATNADVYYFAANPMPQKELVKLTPYVQGQWAFEHGKYDFGSWQKLMYQLGWEKISQYDAIILTNDSNYGPINNLNEIYLAMENKNCDFWSITENYGVHPHLQSYFLYFKKNISNSQAFRNFFETINKQQSKEQICRLYEIGLTEELYKNGFSFATYIDRRQLDVPYGEDISAFQNTLLRAGSPFLKRKVFSDPDFAKEDISETLKLLEERGYPTSLVSIPKTATKTEIRVRDRQPEPNFSPRRGNILKRVLKRSLWPFYAPIKHRVVSKIDTLSNQVPEINDKLSTFRNSIDELSTSIHMQIESLHKEIAKDVATKLTHMQDSMDKLSTDLHVHVSNKIESAQHSLNNLSNSIEEYTGTSQEKFSSILENQTDILRFYIEGTAANNQASLAELHGHLDWVQRDILITIKEKIKFNASQGFKCITDYPVAYDSPDHLHPIGTLHDHTRHPRFIRACEDLFPDQKVLSFLDLGCSAGGIVWDAILRGHIGIGLEGSNISKLQQRAEWRLLRESLFTCDITKPFTLIKNDENPHVFDVVSAWEVLEHLPRGGVHGLFDNLTSHMRKGSILACSISQVDGGFTEDGTPLHQTLEPLAWWRDVAEQHGFELMLDPPFSNLDYARGNGNPSIYYQPNSSYKEQRGDCLLVVFRKK